MLAGMVASVEKVPQLRTLVLRVPLAEIVAVRKETLLGPRLLLVAPPAAQAGRELVLLDRVEQRHRLQRVARSVGALLFLDATLVDRVLHLTNHQLRPDLLRERIPVSDRLREIVPRVDVQQRERDLRRPERLRRQVRHDDRVLPAGKQQRRVLELRCGLAQDENRFSLELVEMV